MEATSSRLVNPIQLLLVDGEEQAIGIAFAAVNVFTSRSLPQMSERSDRRPRPNIGPCEHRDSLRRTASHVVAP